MATIRDKTGNSCPNVCRDRALRETTPPISEGSGRDQHPSRCFDESPCRVRNQAATRNSVRFPGEPIARAEGGGTSWKCCWSSADSRDYGTSLFEVSSSRFYGEGERTLVGDVKNP